MVTYPISVVRNSYRGADPKKRAKTHETNSIATKLESHINQLLKSQCEPVKTYFYYQIAAETGVSEEIVRQLCFSIDCGHNGFTAIKHGMPFEEAMKTHNGS